MKNTIFFSAALLALVCFAACKKDSQNHNGEQPKVAIMAPIDDSAYGFADTVFIKAAIIHTEELHAYKVIAQQIEDGSLTTIKDEHEHSKNVTIDTWFFPNVTAHKHYYIIVEVEDHNGLTGRDSVLVHIDN